MNPSTEVMQWFTDTFNCVEGKGERYSATQLYNMFVSGVAHRERLHISKFSKILANNFPICKTKCNNRAFYKGFEKK